MKPQDIYLAGQLGQDCGMDAASDQPLLLRAATRATGARMGTAFILYELAFGAPFLGAPALAQSAQHVELVGTVAARCSGSTPLNVDANGAIVSEESPRRAATVRCSGNSPILSVRVSSTDQKDVTLTAKGAGGRTGTIRPDESENAITAGTLGDRLATTEGNVTVQIPGPDISLDRTTSPESTGTDAIEIVVSPEA